MVVLGAPARRSGRPSQFVVAALSLASPAAWGQTVPGSGLPILSAPPASVLATTHPFNAAGAQRVPLSLSALPAPYTEAEFFVSGTANVYEYDNPGDVTDDGVTTLGPPLSYVDRILVRAPSDPSRFSGNVVVELFDDALISDSQTIWPLAHQYFTSNGDAWIGVTTAPKGLQALKQYAPARYAGLSWPTSPSTSSCAGGSSGEMGIIYDMIAQLGLALRSGDPTHNPLVALYGVAANPVKATYISSYSQSSSLLLTYDRVFSLDTSVYDGWFIDAGGYRATLNDCEDSKVGPNRMQGPQNSVAPLFQVQTMSEQQLLYAVEGSTYAIPSSSDSDAANDRYRYYDIAGATHIDGTLYDAQPNTADLHAAGGATIPSPFSLGCGDPIRSSISAFPDHYAYDAIWSALENWVRRGVTPPHATRLDLSVDNGYPAGGWRTPAVNEPTVLYHSYTLNPAALLSPVGVCLLTGYQQPISRVASLLRYPTPAVYANRVAADAQALESGGYLTPADAAALIADPSAP